MPEKTLWYKLAFGLVVMAGCFPLFYFVTIETGIAQAASDFEPVVADTGPPFDRYVENLAFGVGEKLSFDVGYGFINAGHATMEVVRLIEYENRPCYQVVTRAQSNKFFSSFYRVDDRVESIIDAVGLFSWRFEKKLREGSYRSDRQYSFDQRRHSVVYDGDSIEVPMFVQDALSVLYYVRSQPLEVGKSVTVEAFVDGRKVSMEVLVHKRETISVEAGTFDCLVVEPLTRSVGVFKHEGRLKVWLTDDRLRLPVLMKSKVLVGSISAELTSFELGEIDEF
ncbi:MAG: DUF3108 domain-containing protein [Candidatus Zixiibacteriota bacterium]|nr:MAG: DUF3108 domain-containing protein [candidate division Zixibacteria bacterium]